MIILFSLFLLSISCETNLDDLGSTLVSNFITSIQEKNFTLLSETLSEKYKVVHPDNSTQFVSRQKIFDYIKLIPGKVTNDNVHVVKVKQTKKGKLRIIANISYLGQCMFKAQKKNDKTTYEIFNEIQRRTKLTPKYSCIINDNALAWNVAIAMNEKYVNAVRYKNLTLLGEVLLNPYPIKFTNAQNKTREEKVSHRTMLNEYTPVNKIVPVDYLIITSAERYDNGTIVFEAHQNRLRSVFTASPVGNSYKIVKELQLNRSKNNRPTLDGLYSMDGQK